MCSDILANLSLSKEHIYACKTNTCIFIIYILYVHINKEQFCSYTPKHYEFILEEK